MATIAVQNFTVKSTIDGTTITVSTYGDGNYIRQDLYSTTAYTVTQAESEALSTANSFGVLDKGNQNYYQKQAEQIPTPKPPEQPAPKPTEKPIPTQEGLTIYQPKTKYTKPKSTSGGEFVEKVSRKPYKGFYIQGYRGLYYAGRSPEDGGVELEKIKQPNEFLQQLAPVGMGLLMMIFTKLFKPTPTSGQTKSGVLPRFFVQDKTNNKIAETDQQSYEEAQKIPTVRTAQTDWIIKGPAEDKNFNGYPFEGAASKNKKAIQALEPQMPGISAFITDYSFLVEDPATSQKPVLSTSTEVEKDPLIKLENDRKANFDLRK